MEVFSSCHYARFLVRGDLGPTSSVRALVHLLRVHLCCLILNQLTRSWLRRECRKLRVNGFHVLTGCCFGRRLYFEIQHGFWDHNRYGNCMWCDFSVACKLKTETETAVLMTNQNERSRKQNCCFNDQSKRTKAKQNSHVTTGVKFAVVTRPSPIALSNFRALFRLKSTNLHYFVEMELSFYWLTDRMAIL